MTIPSGRRRRVLFIGEGSTLAHAVRPLALAAALPPASHETIVASPARYRRFAPSQLPWIDLDAQTPEAFATRLALAEPVFSRALLERYVEQDLALFEAIKPDVVVGDLRLSLAASARLADVPYISLSNAYWSPDRPLRGQRPALDRLKAWPGPLADLVYAAVAPLAFRRHASPVHRLMSDRGLGGIDRDLRRAFTEADITLFADLPGLYRDLPTSPRRRLLGPVAWDPPVDPPDWWDAVPDDRPIVYLALGSSGDSGAQERLAGWLVEFGYTVLASRAGRSGPEGDGRRLFCADYLSGSAAAARASFVVCNGGAPGAAQSLLAGKPVLGIASNLDQFLNMRVVEDHGAGLTLRADALNRRRFETAAARIGARRFIEAAEALQASAQGWDPAAILVQSIDTLLGLRP